MRNGNNGSDLLLPQETAHQRAVFRAKNTALLVREAKRNYEAQLEALSADVSTMRQARATALDARANRGNILEPIADHYSAITQGAGEGYLALQTA